MKIKPFYNSGILYFIASTLVFTMTILGPENEYIDIPHVVLNWITPTTIVFGLGVLLILARMKDLESTVDIITVFLVCSVLRALIPVLYISNMPDFYGYLETSALCVISYFIAKNYVNDTRKMEIAIWFMFVLICLQVALEAYLGPVSYFDDTYYFKNNLIIPIGGSNAIASKLIPCFAFLFCVSKSKCRRFWATIVMFSALGITKSRSGLLAGIVILAIVCVWNGNLDVKRVLQLVLLLLVFGVIFLFFLYKTKIGSFVFYNNTSTIVNRIERWAISLNFFKKYPLFGVSYLMQAADYNPHNWILSVISRGGIVGILLAMGIAVVLIVSFRGKYDNDIIRGSVCFAVAMLIQGLAEIVLFTSTHDFFFWFMLGIAMREASMYQYADRYRGK